jgi:glycine oxidase
VSFDVSESTAFDAVVVGNGTLGLSLGVRLAERGVRTALLGEPQRAGAASAAAGAMLGAFAEVTSTMLKSEGGRFKHDLAVRATKLWDGWLAKISKDGDGSDIRTSDGTFVILNTVGVPGIDDANFAAIRESLVEYDEPFEDIAPSSIDWLDAEATSRPQLAMYLPNEHSVNAAKLLQRLEQAFIRLGGTLVPDLATVLNHSNGRVESVTLASGATLSAPNVVLAGGARTQELLDTLPEVSSQIPRLISGYGVSALVDTEDGTGPRSVIRTPNRAFACGLHVVPRGDGQVYVGATNILSVEPRTTPLISDVQFLLGCATRQVHRNLSEGGIASIQVGNRPVALDGFPLLGQAAVDGLWLMTGTYRDGLHLSPLLADEMSARILGEQGELDLDMFQPVRAPLQSLTREETIETAVVHMLATGYEYDWNVPIEWPYLIEHNLRESYTRAADELDPQFTPPPEILAGLRIRPALDKVLREYYAASRANS